MAIENKLNKKLSAILRNYSIANGINALLCNCKILFD